LHYSYHYSYALDVAVTPGDPLNSRSNLGKRKETGRDGPTSNAAQAQQFAARDYNIWSVILASSVGTMMSGTTSISSAASRCDFAAVYPSGNDTLAMIAYLSTFAVGFVVRPFGALFFGRIGDLVGRKYAFLVTLVIMGGATAAIGFLPSSRPSATLRPFC